MRMPRAILALLMTCGLIAGVGLSRPVAAASATLVVGAGGYATINQAIQAAAAGDAIAIHAGVYPEQVEANKGVTLQPFGDGAVWIDGQCQRNIGVDVTTSGVTVRGLGIRDVRGQGIMITGTTTSSTTIDAVTIQDWDCANGNQDFLAGIAVWYAGSHQTITNSHLTRRVALPGGQRGLEDGIWFKSTSQNPSGGGHYLAGNTIVGGFDGIGGEAEGDVHGAFDGDTTIANNTISQCWDDGIQVDGNTTNVAVTGNRITGCGDGVSLDPAWGGPLTISGNTITGVVGQLDYYGNLVCFKVGGGGTGTAYLTGNTCAMPPGTGGTGITQANDGLSPLVSRQNVLQTDGYTLAFGETPPAGSSFDGDCLWSTDTAGRFLKFGGAWYANLAAFQAATGQELHGTQSTACAPPNPVPSPAPLPSPSPSPSPTPGTWTPWASQGGILTDSPAAASLGSRVYVFAKGSDSALYVKSADASGSFGAWGDLGGILTAAPAAASFNGHVYAFAKGSDDALYVKSSPDGATWTSWSDQGGILLAPPAAASANGRLYVFAMGTDKALYVKSTADGVTWSAWTSLGGILTAAPAAAGYHGRIYAFAKGSDDALYVKSSADGATWSAWADLGGVLVAAPAAATSGDGATLYTFAAGTGGAAYERHSTDGTTWTNWNDLGGSIVGPPTAASIANGPLFVFVCWADNALWDSFSH